MYKINSNDTHITMKLTLFIPLPVHIVFFRGTPSQPRRQCQKTSRCRQEWMDVSDLPYPLDWCSMVVGAILHR